MLDISAKEGLGTGSHLQVQLVLLCQVERGLNVIHLPNFQ